MEFVDRVYETIKFQSKSPLPETQAAFKAFVDAVVPKTPEFSFGASDLHIDEYLIWTLDHFVSIFIVVKGGVNIALSNATAEMLNIAAKGLIDTGGNKEPFNPDKVRMEGAFAALEPGDRFRAITLLEQHKVDLASLPFPFLINQGFVLGVTSILNLLTTLGYYSEWSANASTRLEQPEKRIIEQFPASWKEVGYPGPSQGYHAFRGYLIDKYTD